MNNCRNLLIFHDEILFLLNKVEANIDTLKKIRSEESTESLKDIVKIIKLHYLLAGMKIDSIQEKLEQVSNNLEGTNEVEQE